MPRTWRRKTARGVSEEILKIALEHVAQGETIRSTAKSLGICHVTLARYVKVRRQVHGEGSGDSPNVGYCTGKKVFTDDQEVKVAEFLKAAADRKCELSPRQVRGCMRYRRWCQELSFDAVHRVHIEILMHTITQFFFFTG